MKCYESGTQGSIITQTGLIIENLYYLRMEYVPNGMLFEHCEKNKAMGEDATRFFCKQIVEGLSQMESQRICHRDLKLENILVDNEMNLKIADFGFACDSTKLLKDYRGTCTYMAPEIKLRRAYNGH